jgi:hypothetical protein
LTPPLLTVRPQASARSTACHADAPPGFRPELYCPWPLPGSCSSTDPIRCRVCTGRFRRAAVEVNHVARFARGLRAGVSPHRRRPAPMRGIIGPVAAHGNQPPTGLKGTRTAPDISCSCRQKSDLAKATMLRPFRRIITQAGQKAGVAKFRCRHAEQWHEFGRHSVTECDRAGLVQKQRIDIASRFDRTARRYNPPAPTA